MATSRTSLLVGAAAAAIALTVIGGACYGGRRRLRRRPGLQMRASESVNNLVAITTVAVTGGPCGGKSSSEVHLQRLLEADGYKVFYTPEVATLLVMGGGRYPGYNSGERLLEYERHLMELQMQIESSFVGIAGVQDKPAIVFFDRAPMDVKAYVPPDIWRRLLECLSVMESQLLRRYDAVLHLVTAAEGAEKFFTLENNKARTESPEQARATDRRILAAWSGHPNRVVIDNSFPNFEAKLDAVYAALVRALKMEK